MSITKYPMTVQGARALEEEHLFLSKTERPRLSQAIGEAREPGRPQGKRRIPCCP